MFRKTENLDRNIQNTYSCGWWNPFLTIEDLPSCFVPRLCTSCDVTPKSPGEMLAHINTLEHLTNQLSKCPLESEAVESTAEKHVMCQLCQVTLYGWRSVRSHFRGFKHRAFFRIAKRDLQAAGFEVPLCSEEARRDSDVNHSSTRASILPSAVNAVSSTYEGVARSNSMLPVGNSMVDAAERRDDNIGSRCTSQASQANSWVSSTSQKKQPTPDTSKDRIQKPAASLKRNEGTQSDMRKHEYFLDSEEAENQHSRRNGEATVSRSVDDTKLPVAAGKPVSIPILNKSFEEKRKDIISKLSSCTDVRDLTKQLRHISRVADEKQKTARKTLPGLTFSNREIEKQETFAEARAKAAQFDSACARETDISSTEISSGGATCQKTFIDLSSDLPKSNPINGGSHSVDNLNISGDNASHSDESDGCVVVSIPPVIAPEAISDTDDSENDKPAQFCTESKQNINSTQKASHHEDRLQHEATATSPFDDLTRLAAVASQEAACSEKLRYLSYVLPRVESLVMYLRREHQSTLSQCEALRSAKTGLVAGFTTGVHMNFNSDVFDVNQVVNTLLQPSAAQSLDVFSRQKNAIPLACSPLLPSTGAAMVNTVTNQRSSASNGSTATPSGPLQQAPSTPSSDFTAVPIQIPNVQDRLFTNIIKPTIPSHVGLNSGSPSASTSGSVALQSQPSSCYHAPAKAELCKPSSNRKRLSSTTPVCPVEITEEEKTSGVTAMKTCLGDAKRARLGTLDEQLHSDQILAVRLGGGFVYTSSRDGIVKRTPLHDNAGAVIVYRHSGQDSNSDLKKICAFMLELSIHKKLTTVKLITGADDCALRVFDGDSGQLMKLIPTRARVLSGLIHWQKIFVGLKSGYLQVYNLLDQRFMAESEIKLVPKFLAYSQTASSKTIVVVTQDNSMMLRDAGTLFLLYAVQRRDQDITGLLVGKENIVLSGVDKVYIFGKDGRFCREVHLDQPIMKSIGLGSEQLLVFFWGSVTAYSYDALISGKLHRNVTANWTKLQSSISIKTENERDDATRVTSVDCDSTEQRVAIGTESGRLVVMTFENCSRD